MSDTKVIHIATGGTITLKVSPVRTKEDKCVYTWRTVINAPQCVQNKAGGGTEQISYAVTDAALSGREDTVTGAVIAAEKAAITMRDRYAAELQRLATLAMTDLDASRDCARAWPDETTTSK